MNMYVGVIVMHFSTHVSQSDILLKCIPHVLSAQDPSLACSSPIRVVWSYVHLSLFYITGIISEHHHI